jgi:hypothetical protein
MKKALKLLAIFVFAGAALNAHCGPCGLHDEEVEEAKNIETKEVVEETEKVVEETAETE